MPGTWLKTVTRRDPWRPRWSSRDAIERMIRMLPGCEAGWSTLGVANKVDVKVQGGGASATATNDTVEPKYSVSPREIQVILRSGDEAACISVADLTLNARMYESWRISGIRIPLRIGLGIERGMQVQILIPRAGISKNFPVLRLEHDFNIGAARTTIEVGESFVPKTAEDAEVKLLRKIRQLEKEAAV